MSPLVLLTVRLVWRCWRRGWLTHYSTNSFRRVPKRLSASVNTQPLGARRNYEACFFFVCVFHLVAFGSATYIQSYMIPVSCTMPDVVSVPAQANIGRDDFLSLRSALGDGDELLNYSYEACLFRG